MESAKEGAPLSHSATIESMKLHYSKIISVCCFLFVFVNIGLPSTSFSVFQPYIVALPGVGDGVGSLILSTRTLLTFLAMFVVSIYYQKLDCRVAVTGGCILVSSGFACYAIGAHFAILPLFFLAAALTGLGYGLGGNVAVALLTGRWYHTSIGTAAGFAAVGSGVAGMVIPPIALHLIEGISLSAAFAFDAAITAVAGTVVFALIRNHPADIGAHPYGWDNEKDGDPNRIIVKKRDTTGTAAGAEAGAKVGTQAAGAEAGDKVGTQAAAKTETGSLAFIPLSKTERMLMFIACVGVGIVCMGALSYLSILMTTNGFSSTFSALMISVTGITLTASKLLSGIAFDRLGTLKGTAAVYALEVVSLALLCLAPLGNPILMVVAVALFGAGASTGSTGISTWSIELSTPKERAKLVRNLQIGYTFGGFVGNTFPGLLAEACSSYVPAFAIILITTAISGIILVRIYQRRQNS